MSDEMMFEYLLQMGAMRPEQDEMKRKQALVDALRGNALEPMQGQMVSGHYVGPGIAGALSKLGQAYFAKQGQAGVDAGMSSMNDRQRQLLEEMRRRRGMRPQLSGTPGTDAAFQGITGYTPWGQ